MGDDLRELDVRVWRELFGRKCYLRCNRWVYVSERHADGYDVFADVPQFSTSISAAFRVAAEIYKRWSLKFSLEQFGFDKWACHFGTTSGGTQKTAEEAICWAAIAFVQTVQASQG